MPAHLLRVQSAQGAEEMRHYLRGEPVDPRHFLSALAREASECFWSILGSPHRLGQGTEMAWESEPQGEEAW